MIADALPEEVRPLTLSVLERIDRCSALQGGLRELAVVEVDASQDGLLLVLSAVETMALKDVLDPAVTLRMKERAVPDVSFLNRIPGKI